MIRRLLAFVLLAWLLGFAWFALLLPQPLEAEKRTDTIVVLTGGASALVGFGEFAANTLGRPARVARPQAPTGLPQGVSSPAFSTVAGLLAVAASGSGEAAALRSRDGLAGGYFERVGEWLKTGFA